MNLIVCLDDKNGIGKNNKLAWSLKQDLKYFCKITTNTIVIMGRNTWDSLPVKPLKNRLNLVLSKSMYSTIYENTFFFSTFLLLNEFLKNIESNNEIFIIGGKSIYEYFLKENLIKKIYMTKINHNYNCDVFFPNIDLNDKFKIISNSDYIIENNIKYKYIEYILK
tara:strand:+ start:410 stop:907 length:498 start_codon:yes stop_codon:yes gene_type:complete